MDQQYPPTASPRVEVGPESAGAPGVIPVQRVDPVQRVETQSRGGVTKQGRGRPSLGGQGRSPQVTFRAPPALRAAAEERAARDGKTVSQLAREAFELYLHS